MVPNVATPEIDQRSIDDKVLFIAPAGQLCLFLSVEFNKTTTVFQ